MLAWSQHSTKHTKTLIFKKKLRDIKMQEVEMTPAQLMQERRKFKMPRSTFRVLTLNGVTTVAAIDEGKFFH